ncbi:MULTISPECIES: hypothetical protein [unclassified Plantibacter]|uniref:hypothetical protein n=1 Tax=unclassified Plantibacter TaxID=2624265 RepID=UPI003D328E1B
MYAALWRILPGPVWLRIILMLILLFAVIAALFTWVFPWIDSFIVDQNVTVQE